MIYICRAESEGQRLSRDKIVQIHGDIFETRCSNCESRWREQEAEAKRRGIFRNVLGAAN